MCGAFEEISTDVAEQASQPESEASTPDPADFELDGQRLGDLISVGEQRNESLAEVIRDQADQAVAFAERGQYRRAFETLSDAASAASMAHVHEQIEQRATGTAPESGLAELLEGLFGEGGPLAGLDEVVTGTAPVPERV